MYNILCTCVESIQAVIINSCSVLLYCLHVGLVAPSPPLASVAVQEVTLAVLQSEIYSFHKWIQRKPTRQTGGALLSFPLSFCFTSIISLEPKDVGFHDVARWAVPQTFWSWPNHTHWLLHYVACQDKLWRCCTLFVFGGLVSIPNSVLTFNLSDFLHLTVYFAICASGGDTNSHLF